MPKDPYPYEVNGRLVTGNGFLIPICSLSNRSFLPSLTVPNFMNLWHSPHQVFQTFRRPWAEDEPRKKNLAFSMTKRTFLRPSDHRGWVLLCFAFYLLSQLIRGTTPTQEVLNSIPSTSSSIHFNTQISFPVAPCARYPIFKKNPPGFRTYGTNFETRLFLSNYMIVWIFVYY